MSIQDLARHIKEKREAAGLSLEDVANRIKVSPRILQCIDKGELSRLPHAVYSRAFIKSYAQVVGADGDLVAQTLKNVFPDDDDNGPQEAIMLVHRPNKGLPRIIKYLIYLLVLLLLAAGGWFIYQRYGKDITDVVSQSLSTTKGQREHAGSASAAVPKNAAAGNGLPAGETPLSLRNQEPPPPTPVAPSEAAAAVHAEPSPASGESPGEPPREKTIFIGQAAEQQIHITGHMECWIDAKADGASVGRKFTVRPGENFTLPFNKSITLILGNAGGVEIQYKDTVLNPAGKSGERKVLKFPPES